MKFSWVTPKAEIRNSKIEGKGLFASTDIKKGETVIVQAGRIVSNADLSKRYKKFLRICFPISQGLHICPIEPRNSFCDGAFLINHSCDPNCGIRGQVVFVAMRKIAAGEELTYDYAMTDASEETEKHLFDEMSCNCGSKKCRKIIGSQDWKKAILQKRYKGYFSDFVSSLQKN